MYQAARQCGLLEINYRNGLTCACASVKRQCDHTSERPRSLDRKTPATARVGSESGELWPVQRKNKKKTSSVGCSTRCLHSAAAAGTVAGGH